MILEQHYLTLNNEDFFSIYFDFFSIDLVEGLDSFNNEGIKYIQSFINEYAVLKNIVDNWFVLYNKDDKFSDVYGFIFDERTEGYLDTIKQKEERFLMVKYYDEFSVSHIVMMIVDREYILKFGLEPEIITALISHKRDDKDFSI